MIDVKEDDVVLLPSSVFEDFQLMQLKPMQDRAEATQQKKFLIVNDVWDFDNIGVSKDIPKSLMQDGSKSGVQFELNGEQWYIDRCMKYLICSDCDKGPVGIVCAISKQEHTQDQQRVVNLLSLQSVMYV